MRHEEEMQLREQRKLQAEWQLHFEVNRKSVLKTPAGNTADFLQRA